MANDPQAPAPRGLGAALVALGTLLYLSLWFNNWLGLTTDGWFFFYGRQLARGVLPYRDYSLLVPPLTVFEAAALVRLFGEHLLVTHLVGLCQRVVFALIAYVWLAPLTSRRAAMFAAFTMIVVSSSDIADTLFSYHFEAALWALLAGYAASRALAAAEGSLAARPAARRFLFAAALAGMAAAGSALTKQTTGLLATATICAVVFVLLWQALGQRVAFRFAFAYAVGWATPMALFALWLARHGIGRAFVDALFLRGAAAKGNLTHVLARPIAAIFASPALRPAALAALLLIGAVLLSRRLAQLPSTDIRRLALWGTGGGALLAVLAGAYVLPIPRFPRIVAVYVAFFGCLGVLGVCAFRMRRGSLDAGGRQRALFAAVGLVSAYGFALSWPAWEMMAAPGLALLVALALGSPTLPTAVRALVAGLCAALVALSTSSKLASPYSWGEWVEPSVRTATVRPANPVLAGFRLSPSTASFVDTVTQLVAQHSKPGDRIFVFPHMPLFYLFADRKPATFSYAHWFDMTPDHVAQLDAQRLLDDPPAVIVNYEISPVEWGMNEREFRGGAPAGQRRVLDAIHELAARPGYQMVAEFPAPMTGNRVTVWARREPIASTPPSGAQQDQQSH